MDCLLGEHGIAKDSPAGRRTLEQRVEARRAAEASGEYQPIRRGWCLGADEFRRKLLAQADKKLEREHYGVARAEIGEGKAERILAEQLRRRRWTEETLAALPKGALGKVEIALRLRAETVQTTEWIAKKLHMGSRQYATNLIHKERP